jgi:rubrerythrin
MLENQKALEVLSTAICREIKAFKLYLYMKDRIEDKKVRFLCKNLAADEDLHRKTLEDRYNNLAEGKNFVVQDKDVELHSVGAVTTMNRVDLINLAIKLEKQSQEFYLNQSKKIDDKKSYDILRDLVEIEKEHERKLTEILKELQ